MWPIRAPIRSSFWNTNSTAADVSSCGPAKCAKVYAGHEPAGQQQYLKEYADSLPELGRFTMDVQAQPGRKARKGAEFLVRGGPLLICPPHARYGRHGDDPLPLYVVQITEIDPPAGEKRIDWTLLTNEPVQTFKDAWRVASWYERRWIVEEYHKAKKTGCQIEDMQFTTTARLEPAIALVVGGGGNAAQPSRRQSPPGRQNTPCDHDPCAGLRRGAEPEAIP